MTGLHPQTSGVVGYKAKPITYPTLPSLLAAAGYSTVLVGRTMHQTPPEAPYGYQTWLKGSTYIGDDDYDRENAVHDHRVAKRMAGPTRTSARCMRNTLSIGSSFTA